MSTDYSILDKGYFVTAKKDVFACQKKGDPASLLIQGGKIYQVMEIDKKWCNSDTVPSIMVLAEWNAPVYCPSNYFDIGTIFQLDLPEEPRTPVIIPPKCECGAGSVGVADFGVGHSSYCDVRDLNA